MESKGWGIGRKYRDVIDPDVAGFGECYGVATPDVGWVEIGDGDVLDDDV